MRKIDSIIIHCTATPEGRDVSVGEIRRWHLARGFADIGYHYVIGLDGTVETGRPVETQGAHCSGHNAHSIGICYVGGCSSDGKTAKDTRTAAQRESMLSLVRTLMRRYHLSPDSVHGHNEFANKACPCFDVRRWLYGELRKSSVIKTEEQV